IVTSVGEIADRARHLTTQAKLPGRNYEHDDIGYNYRLSNLASALGIAQLEQLEGFLSSKGQIAAEYRSCLDGLELTPPPSEEWAIPSFWLYSILLEHDDRDAVLEFLNASKIAARPLWPPIHEQTPYRHLERLGGEVSQDIYRRGVSLPSSVGLTSTEIKRVAQAVRQSLVATNSHH
ncbi:MAG: DegT/DnrJ/EryC1/StrS family aminotransferase, partial [Acidimicrobiales bacterium]